MSVDNFSEETGKTYLLHSFSKYELFKTGLDFIRSVKITRLEQFLKYYHNKGNEI